MRYVVFLILLLSMACTANNPDKGTGAPELDTTEAGLATGAVIGAGVGALVGSTAGEAGAGLVLGSIAGATSGGLIGKSIEGQEKRIDQHDARSGINTRAKKDNSRSSLSETIWASSPSKNNNRPSGTKGIASRYVDPIESRDLVKQDDDVVQLRQDRQSAPSVPKVVSSTAKNTFSYKERNATSNLPLATQPSIELQKPKPELPSFNANNDSRIPSRKPSLLDNNSMSRAPDLKNKTLDTSARAKLNESKLDKAKNPVIPEKTEQVSALKSKTLPVVEDKKLQNAVDDKAKEITSEVKNQVEDKTTHAKSVSDKAKSQVVSASCETGAKDYERAKSASSDSDKVFYLRRVIVACPKETSARLELGKVYSKLGLKDEAKKEFNAVLDKDPSNEAAQDEMSIMMLDSRKN